MEYLKVMLVDDEDLVIEDIQALIDWEAHGFRVVGFAYNGRQAQRLVEEVQPDIIFIPFFRLIYLSFALRIFLFHLL